MPAEHDFDLFETAVRGDVTVIRFKRRTILDPDAIEAAGERLAGLTRAGARKFVLDFSGVESLTSGMFGKFMALHQAVESAGGRVVFCSVGPFLKQIFTICNIPAAIPVLADEDEAVRQLGG